MVGFRYRDYSFGLDRDDAPVAELTSVTTARYVDPADVRERPDISARADIALRNAGAQYLVTVVDRNGREYNYARPLATTGSYNYNTIRAAAHITWNTPVGADVDFYRVYRSAIEPQITALYTPGSAEAMAEEDRVNTKHVTFSLAAVTNKALAYTSGAEASWDRLNFVASSGVTGVASVPSNKLWCLQVSVKSTVSVVVSWPMKINSISGGSGDEPEKQHTISMSLLHYSKNGEQRANRSGQKIVVTQADVSSPGFTQQIDFNVSDIQCEAEDCLELWLYFISKHTRTLNYSLPTRSGSSNRDMIQVTLYSRDREPTPVQPTRAAYVPVSAGMGLLAEVRGNTFTDYNFLPDMTIIPPVHDNPFAEARLGRLRSVSGGDKLNINLADINAPRQVRRGVTPIVDRTGQLTGALVRNSEINPGSVLTSERNARQKTYTVTNHVNTVGGELNETLIRSGGTDGRLVFDLDLEPDYPLCTAVYQQRRIFAGGSQNGTRIWGSRVGDHTDFALERVPTDAGPWQFDIDVSTEANITHMLQVPLGLLIFTRKAVWLLSSGEEGAALTATQNSLTQQSGFGCSSTIPPLLIGNSVYYVTGNNTSVIRLQYSRETRQYAGIIASRLISHILTADNPATAWAYAQVPHSRLYITLRSGGQLVAFVDENSGNVSFTTQGVVGALLRYTATAVARSNDTDVVYHTIGRQWIAVHGASAPTGIEKTLRI